MVEVDYRRAVPDLLPAHAEVGEPLADLPVGPAVPHPLVAAVHGEERFTGAGELGVPELLVLLRTPPELLGPATRYLRLVLGSFGLMYASFLIMSTLRAVGNTKVPLLFVVLGTALNQSWIPC